MNNDNLNKKIWAGYAIFTLQQLKCANIFITNFLDELENTMNQINETTALEIIDNFYNETNEQVKVIFEGIDIPSEYNLVEISALFENYGFMGKEHNYMGKRICNALKKENIIYIKHLYKKTKSDILYVRSIGENAYKSFYFFLKTIFCEN